MEELAISIYSLGDSEIKEYYKETINQDDCRSITFTLNPILYSADILTQFRTAIQEIKKSKIFYEKVGGKTLVHPDFYEMIIVPELTNTINIHFHGYFRCNPEKAQYFYNEFRKFVYNNSVFGRQMMFKQIDDLNDRVKEYPFKDIEVLKKFPDSKKIYIYKITKNNLDF